MKLFGGGLQYDLVFSELCYLFGEENVKFIPYEYLLADPVFFVEQIAEFWSCSSTLKYYANSPAENVNKSEDGSHIIRDINLSGRILSKILWFYKRRYPLKFPPHLEESLKGYFMKISNKLSRMKGVGSIVLDDSSKQKIWEMYAETNRRFTDISGIDIDKLGYPI